MAEENLPDLPKLSLHAIYLRQSECRMAEWFHPAIPGTILAPVFRSAEGRVTCNNTTFVEEGGDGEVKWCNFISRFQFAYVRSMEDGSLPKEGEIEAHIAAEISAEIAADYMVGSPDFPPIEELQRWATNNVMLHSWPYWREFCHNTMLRMNLPVTMIPLINIGRQADE